jgi:hypothetical protein
LRILSLIIAWLPAIAIAGERAPAYFRPALAAVIISSLREPGSVSDPAVSEPFLRWMVSADRYIVCVRFNARNGFGGMTGPAELMAVYEDGDLVRVIPAAAGECREARYMPFPELRKDP